MIHDSTWATDIEKFAAASLLDTDIYVYTKVNSAYKWNKFSKTILDGSLPKNNCAIYINHTNGVRYDIVEDVSLNLQQGTKRKSNVVNICKKPKTLVVGNNDKVGLPITEARQSSAFSKNVFKQQNNVDHKISSSDRIGHVEKTAQYQPKVFETLKQINPKSNVETSESCILDKATTVNSTKHIFKFHNCIKYCIYQCKVCQEAWPIKTKPKFPESFVCLRCSRDKASPKKFSSANFMIPLNVPPELQGLTQIEEMLIARAIPIMRVYVKPGGQRGYSGHCLNLPQDISKLANRLPRYCKDIPLILVIMKGKKNTYKDVFVRRDKVENALNWLIINNPVYRDVEIDVVSLQ